jgi:hypothetical protein
MTLNPRDLQRKGANGQHGKANNQYIGTAKRGEKDQKGGEVTMGLGAALTKGKSKAWLGAALIVCEGPFKAKGLMQWDCKLINDGRSTVRRCEPRQSASGDARPNIRQCSADQQIRKVRKNETAINDRTDLAMVATVSLVSFGSVSRTAQSISIRTTAGTVGDV